MGPMTSGPVHTRSDVHGVGASLPPPAAPGVGDR